MSESRIPYVVSGQSDRPRPETMEPFGSPVFSSPTSEDVRALLRYAGLTGAQAGQLVGVDGRTIRRWTAQEGTAGHREIPYAAWRLMLIAADLINKP